MSSKPAKMAAGKTLIKTISASSSGTNLYQLLLLLKEETLEMFLKEGWALQILFWKYRFICSVCKQWFQPKSNIEFIFTLFFRLKKEEKKRKEDCLSISDYNPWMMKYVYCKIKQTGFEINREQSFDLHLYWEHSQCRLVLL